MALLPWLLHLGIGPTDAGGALWAALLMTTLPAGTPAPVGGSGRLAEALTGLVSAYGGEIRTGVDVDAVVTAGGRATGVQTADGEQLTAIQAVIASTTPPSDNVTTVSVILVPNGVTLAQAIVQPFVVGIVEALLLERPFQVPVDFGPEEKARKSLPHALGRSGPEERSTLVPGPLKDVR